MVPHVALRHCGMPWVGNRTPHELVSTLRQQESNLSAEDSNLFPFSDEPSSCVYAFSPPQLFRLSGCHGRPDEHTVSACTAGLSPLFLCVNFGCPDVCNRPHRIKWYYFPHYMDTTGLEPVTDRL